MGKWIQYYTTEVSTYYGMTNVWLFFHRETIVWIVRNCFHFMKPYLVNISYMIWWDDMLGKKITGQFQSSAAILTKYSTTLQNVHLYYNKATTKCCKSNEYRCTNCHCCFSGLVSISASSAQFRCAASPELKCGSQITSLDIIFFKKICGFVVTDLLKENPVHSAVQWKSKNVLICSCTWGINLLSGKTLRRKKGYRTSVTETCRYLTSPVSTNLCTIFVCATCKTLCQTQVETVSERLGLFGFSCYVPKVIRVTNQVNFNTYEQIREKSFSQVYFFSFLT